MKNNDISKKPICVKAVTPTISKKYQLWKADTLTDIADIMIPKIIRKIKISSTDWILEFDYGETVAGIFV